MKNASFSLAPSQPHRKARNFRPLLSTIAALLLSHSAGTAQAQTTGFAQTAGGTYDFNDPANWVNGVINGIWHESLTIEGGQTATFAADTQLPGGLDFSYVGGHNVTLRGTGGDRTVTLAGDILVNTASTTRNITIGNTGTGQNLNVDLGGEVRSFTVGTGRTLGFVNVISNGGIIARGGTLNFSGANTYGGPTIVTLGNFSLNGAVGSAANSDFYVNAANSAATLTFNSTTNGTTGTTRAQSVTLTGVGGTAGAALTVSGNSTASSVDTIAQALTAAGGYGIVTLSANAAQNLQLVANNFVREPGATLFIRGTNLGTAPIASPAAGVANLHFTAAPALSGSGTIGTTTVGILKGTYGDIVSNSNGNTSSLLTYDPANGVRLLDSATEYKTTITNGQTQLDNILLARAFGGVSQDVNLTAPTTTIQSLSFKITGAGTESGVTVSGDAGTALKLSSGVIHASQTVTTATATDAMVISVPTLDLNGQEGVFLAFTNGISNANTPAPLRIESVIANDGGNGVTIGGNGQVIFAGSEANTYIGVTTINSGILRLQKTGANIGLTTDLVMNGGTLLKNSNAIADTANITMNGGTFWFDTTSSSGNNGHQETINNLTMNAGSMGHHGSNAVFIINGDSTLNGSQLAMNQGGDLTVLGTTTLNGGHLIAREASSTTLANATTTLDDVAIVNQPSDAYTAATLNGHATNVGALLTINGDVTFTGNATNANPVGIVSSDPALANQGVIALNGMRTFNVGNGAAAVDLEITPALANSGATESGLTKTGTGTLALLGANTYTGETIVNGGTLAVHGSISGGRTIVNNTGTLAGIGTVGLLTISDGGTLSPGDGPGTLSAADVIFQHGTRFAIDLQKDASGTPGTHWDQLAIEGFLDLTTALDGGVTLALSTYAGDSTTFDPNANHLWSSIITTTFGFDGFADDRFVFDFAGFDAAINGTFSVVQNGNDLDLLYVAVPEPGSALMLLGGLGMLAARRRNRGRHSAQSH